jgi:serine protease Do
MHTKLLLAISLVFSPAVVQAQDVSDKLERLEKRYRGSLVQVRYTQQVMISTSEPPQQEELTTTGVVVSADGMVMVSGVVFEPFNQVPHGVGIRFPASVTRVQATIDEARIQFVDGTEYSASLLGRDPEADVAFFGIEAGDRNFEPVTFKSPPLPTVGEELVVLSLLPEPLGPALAIELTRVQAVVSNPTDGFLVSTGASDPVGSLVCDLEGEPVGMLDALTVSMPGGSLRNPLSFLSVLRDLPKGVGRGFARPASQFAAAASRPPVDTPVRRGWLGVELQALTPELASHLGLSVTSGIIIGYVYRESPAEGAGLATGDILTELQGEPIEVSRDEDLGAFSEKVLRAGAEAELRLGYLRDGEPRETTARLVPAPKMAREAETIKVDALDITVREVTFDYLATRNLDPDKQGVVVKQPPVAVRTNPRRVQRGDLLVKVGDQKVSDLAEFRRVVESLREDKPDEVVLFIERGKESFFFAVKPEWN